MLKGMLIFITKENHDILKQIQEDMKFSNRSDTINYIIHEYNILKVP